MKLLLFNLINTNNISEVVFPNLGLGYLASYLRKFMKNIEIKIINSNGNNVDKVFSTFCPDVVGISAVSQNFDYVNILANKCYLHRIPVFVGGIHISSLPQSLPQSCSVGVVGEGERTILDLMRCFSQYGFDRQALRDIEGLVFRDGSGQIVMTPGRKLIKNMDELPFPARDLLNVERNGFLYLFSSRGCKHRCTFCSNSRFWKSLRLFSADYVFNELKQVVNEYHPRAITFYDDDFLASKERLRKLVSLIERNGINKKTEFNLMSRPDMIDEESIALMKRMNVTVVSLGLESGCQKILDFLKNGTTSVQNNMKATELLDKVGILTYGFFIIGSPEETEKDIFDTLNFISKSPIAGFSIYTLVPYPGTPIWDYAKKKNLVSDNMNWGRLALNINETTEDIVVISEELSREKLYHLYWLFKKEQRKRHLLFMLKRAKRNPGLIIPRIRRSLRFYLRKLENRSNDKS